MSGVGYPRMSHRHSRKRIKEVSHSLPKDATHEMGFARTVANRVVFLEEGKIVEETDSKEFFTNPKTSRAKEFLSKVMH